MVLAMEQATLAFTRALHRFQAGLTDEELSQFKFTTIDDVWDAARYLQREQSSRFSMRNMGRLAPFINGLSRYSSVIEVFVQAKPDIMAFIWGPLKLLLQVANNYENHFDKLLDALQSIGENLPRFLTFEKIFQYDERLQEVVAMVYEDIMEFLRRMWRFFRRRSWHILLDSLWSDFQNRFQVILGNLQRHKDLLDKEAVSSEIQEASFARKAHEQLLERIDNALDCEIQNAAAARRRAETEIEKNERDRVDSQRTELFRWIDSIDCRDDKENAGRHRHPDTGLWLFDCKEFRDWSTDLSSILWLTGKPGCGKTVLVSAMIEELESRSKKQVLYFFFDYKDIRKNNLASLLRALTSQLLMLNADLLPFASQWRQQPSAHASETALKQHFLELLNLSSEPIYIVIDGLDECGVAELPWIQRYLSQLLRKYQQFLHICITSREMKLERALENIGLLRLEIGKDKNNHDVHSYIASELQNLQEILKPDIVLTDSYLGNITEKIANLADGMFLWARLVIEGLFEVTTLGEIEVAIHDLPEGLDQAYGRILQRIESEPNNPRQRQTFRILKWLACAERPVTVPEVEGWLSVEPGCVDTKLGRPTIRTSGPLIEVLPNLHIQFVHFSAKEYILRGNGRGMHQSPFLSALAVHLNAFTICATYLCYGFLDVDAPDTMLANIRNGDYCLLSYSKNYWLRHFETCCKLGPDVSSARNMVTLLSRVVQLRRNLPLREYVAPACNESYLLQTLGNVQGIEPQTLSVLQVIKHHDTQLQKQYTQGLSVDDVHKWHVDNHPLILARRYWQTQAFLERYMESQPSEIPTPQRQELQRLYGDNIYFCRHPACEGNTIPRSFATASGRDAHENIHSRPFNCPHSTCDYSRIGFTTKKGYNQHLRNYHTTVLHVNLDSLSDIGNTQITKPPTYTQHKPYIDLSIFRNLGEGPENDQVDFTFVRAPHPHHTTPSP